MKPYYQDDRVTLYHGDCREVTEWLAADVLVTDPPYGTQLASTKNGNPGGYGRGTRAERKAGVKMIANDLSTDCRDAALALWGERAALVFGSPRFPDPPIRVADRLVWDKKRPGINGGPWRYRHESIYVTEGFNRTSDAAVSIIAVWPSQEHHIHEKPIDLMTQLIAAAPLGIIADPFTGSGSTLVAAARLGRSVIGVEVDEALCEITARRLDQGVLDFGGIA